MGELFLLIIKKGVLPKKVGFKQVLPSVVLVQVLTVDLRSKDIQCKKIIATLDFCDGTARLDTTHSRLTSVIRNRIDCRCTQLSFKYKEFKMFEIIKFEFYLAA